MPASVTAAAILLILLGASAALPIAGWTYLVFRLDDVGLWPAGLAAFLGVGLAILGGMFVAIHVASAVGIVRRRRWGRILGMATCGLGAFVAIFIPLVFFVGPLLGFLFAIAYALILIALARRGDAFA